MEQKPIKISIKDKDSYFAVNCECGKRYKNARHKPYKKHIKNCEIYKREESYKKNPINFGAVPHTKTISIN